jgi:guanine nucleotide-binding protein subunit alpha
VVKCFILTPLQSQLEEALVLFKEISNLATFKQAALVLFLNKVDLLQDKLRNGMSPIRRYHPDYTGDETDVQAAQAYLADKFRSLYRNKEKELHIHFTTATDTSFLDLTMRSVRKTILHHNLEAVLLS